MIEGNFIVLEGVDGAGTTTHTRILQEALMQRGLPVRATREPSDGPVGVLIRQILSGRCVVPGLHGSRPPSWTTMALLFAADRTDHIEAEIVPNMMDGVTVISDRYDYSSVAYQSVSAGEEGVIEWVKTLNAHARRPDLTIVLDIAPDVAEQRRIDRRAGREIYDDSDLQRQLADFYTKMETHFPDDRIVHIDADRSIDEVARDVMNAVRALRNEDPLS
ncbi:MAG: dTMP kinase [Sandaracinus sp.]|nr:dTMP kinase [Sandaracinus sp.]|tara:strand:+ start:524 stop:1180 length:657 start_codon:yes stop_codon:yes gene_type:complete